MIIIGDSSLLRLRSLRQAQGRQDKFAQNDRNEIAASAFGLLAMTYFIGYLLSPE